MFESIIFFLLAGLAIGCAVSVVYQRNPLYSAISLIGVFIALAGLYLTLAAPFIAAVQILIYAGAIMVLVIFVIMLLNLDEEPRSDRLRYLYVLGGMFGVALLAQAFFIFYAVTRGLEKGKFSGGGTESVGLTKNLGQAMFTEYLLPFEVVGLLLLMAIVGAMLLTRRAFNPKIEIVAPKETKTE
jgi:NADH-quinone oxidoreductase subunit J